MILRFIAVLAIFAVLMAGLRWLASKSSDAKTVDKRDDTKERSRHTPEP